MKQSLIARPLSLLLALVLSLSCLLPLLQRRLRQPDPQRHL